MTPPVSLFHGYHGDQQWSWKSWQWPLSLSLSLSIWLYSYLHGVWMQPGGSEGWLFRPLLLCQVHMSNACFPVYMQCLFTYRCMCVSDVFIQPLMFQRTHRNRQHSPQIIVLALNACPRAMNVSKCGKWGCEVVSPSSWLSLTLSSSNNSFTSGFTIVYSEAAAATYLFFFFLCDVYASDVRLFCSVCVTVMCLICVVCAVSDRTTYPA